ncbi:hypothetical protein AAFP30_27965 [Gordonia sp. CPCC 205515]|uniref:hypothetical protein n=1 Tax=Gordonia sp. CPCC 205515 TaxID=3140791 RepID=UPI003AF3D3B1
MTDTDTREPLLWVTSTSGWVEEALVARLLPPAAALDGPPSEPAPTNPYLVVVAAENQPACELLMRQHGVIYDDAGAVHQNVPAGWTIAATIFVATTPGRADKQFRNYAAALADDPDRIVIRLPFVPQWRLSPINRLPQWDLTPPAPGRRQARRDDRLPPSVAADFTRLMAHVRTRHHQHRKEPDEHRDAEGAEQQCA